MKNRFKKEYLVSLIVEPQSENLEKVSKLLKIPYSNGSCNKGDMVSRNRKSKRTVWRYKIGTKNKRNLDGLIGKLITVLERSLLKRKRSFPGKWKVYLDIAVLYNTYTCSFEIKANHLEWFSKRGIGLLASCYPTVFKN